MNIFISDILIVLFFISSALCLKSFKIDGINYYFSDPVKKNWHQAHRYCSQKGLYLLDLETEDEYHKVLQYLRDHTDEVPIRTYWTGGTSQGSDGEFYWITSGAEIKYNGFGDGQPDNANDHNEYCLEINKVFDFKWNDAPCDLINYFICRETKYFNIASMTSPSHIVQN